MVECDSSAALSSGPDSSRLSMTDRLKRKKQKFSEVQDRYINCDFILGSVAEVERIWSLAKYILADTRKSTSPLAFEAIVFLNVNANYWNERTVQLAMSRARSQRVQQALHVDEEHIAFES